jgi:hypothetical protein
VNQVVLEFGAKPPPIGVHEQAGTVRPDGRECERSMLVEVREFMELPERVDRLLVVKSVRLARFDPVECLDGQPSESILPETLVEEFVFGPANRKERHPVGRESVLYDQGVNEMIKRRSQVVQDVPDNAGDSERWLSGDMECETGFACARIAISTEVIRARVQIGPDFMVEEYQMNVGPPELFKHTRERM